MRQFLLRKADCAHCERTLNAGSAAHRQGSPAQYRCLACGPWPVYPEAFSVTYLPNATAEGAEDSRQAQLKAKTGKGRALKSGVPETPSGSGRNRKTKKQRQLIAKQRHAQQQSNGR